MPRTLCRSHTRQRHELERRERNDSMVKSTPARREEVMSSQASTSISNGETMSAIVQDAYGIAPEAVLRLAEIARPTIGDDEVLVRVAAASVDMGTWHCMTGMPYAMRLMGFGVRSPKASNPGRALAG